MKKTLLIHITSGYEIRKLIRNIHIFLGTHINGTCFFFIYANTIKRKHQSTRAANRSKRPFSHSLFSQGSIINDLISNLPKRAEQINTLCVINSSACVEELVSLPRERVTRIGFRNYILLQK